ncbi:CitMHS family transporter [Schinkia azotoformans]|uniref:CitMHS family transporter n=1 Tax=Schinkia azotoformans TaxID=1454 RepID=UPI002DBD5F62|nr:CitMHS family transporter [Schinkia azotoformans]MEC1719894.1 CitMHS family transporter [Schinkia azotoformans]MED4412538.1 CitMHS family transporter [Schinkia azotoformans]
MLTFLGSSMVIVFTYLIMSRRLSPVAALVIVPIIFALFGGFGIAELGDMMADGIKTVASSAALLLFAILFFGIMIDAGLFDPLIKKILTIVKGDPVKIAIGTAIIAMTVALDGDGTTTHMITISAMLPLYMRIGMNPLGLATISLLSVSIMSGMTPWGGPATRAIVSLGLDANEFFVPILPTMLAGMASILFIAFLIGKKERARLGVIDLDIAAKKNSFAFAEAAVTAAATVQDDIKRPKLIWFNLLLTVAVMVVLIAGILPAAVIFLIGFVIAAMVNYPSIQKQSERIASHAGNAITVVILVFAAGIFAGIFSGTKMVDAIANSMVSIIPESLGGFFPTVVALTSMPLTFVLSNDAYYFGVLPILAEAGAAYGVDPLEVARASVLGQPVHFLSPLVASTFLLVGMLKTDFGTMQRYAFKWAILCSLAIIIVAFLTGAI